MLDRFADTFGLLRAEGIDHLDIGALRRQWGGTTLRQGLYRIHTDASGAAAKQWVSDAFPDLADRFGNPIGFDWLGRQFVTTEDDTEPTVLLADVGAAEVLEIPATLVTFHDQVLIDDDEPALAASFFDAWRQASGVSDLAFDDCVGYRLALFVGGTDTVENLEVCDLDVYWTINGQLSAAARR